MFRLSVPKLRSLTVTAVAGDPLVLDGLGHYLKRRVAFRSVRALDDAFAASATSDVVIYYPDGFPAGAGQRLVRRLVGNATLSLILIVTARAAQFSTLAHVRIAANRVVVLSKPAWPWELFATIESTFPHFRRLDSVLC